ncbi:salicylate hydroxylase [Colletotrichum navitas]|uniref:Salicylate hydroxylase n=1 Tax=Colletotrichum navitas TaxID=681940 RepID=A0AAD8UXK5_9PEZI|nr:salicylate hydroxylase [Colletotrichum navitas]KAK1572787.1 salicylate hydroxylase [Colletotrichum navitas]
MSNDPSLKVIIVGAGIGGLTCAIGCRREGFEVVVLERASRIIPMGAGIQVPPNGTKVARQLGFLDKLHRVADTVDTVELRRFGDGNKLCELTEAQCRRNYGDPWMVAHRADFHNALWQTCQELGVSLNLSMEVESIDFENDTVYMEDGDEISGDLIIGADGALSVCRDQFLGKASPLIETGDVAYRAVLPIQHLRALNDPQVNDLCAQNKVLTWLGPGQHTVFYPVRGGREINLILIRQKCKEPEHSHIEGDVGEMRNFYAGWDETLRKIISSVPRVQKWMIRMPPKVDLESRDHFVLLGDAFHSNLPYQAQGAAMAMEDGAFLAKLLGLAKEHVRGKSAIEKATMLGHSEEDMRDESVGERELKKLVPAVLQAYGVARGTRASDALRGEGRTEPLRKWFHVPKGLEQEARDAELAGYDFDDESLHKQWRLHCDSVLGYDAVYEATKVAKTYLKIG